MGAKWQVLGGLGHGVQRARALGKCVGRGQQVKARTGTRSALTWSSCQSPCSFTGDLVKAPERGS